MEQVIAPDHFFLWVREKSECVAGLLLEVVGDIRRVDADRYRGDAEFLEVGQMLLDTSQLEVAKRSPKPSIENEQNGFRRVALRGLRKQARQRDLFAAAVGQREVGSLLPRARRA